jgi:hypothetical protein
VPKYLLRTQLNDVFKAIEKSGLDPGEFDWSDGDDRDRLTHLPSGFSFEFVESPLHGRFIPSPKGPEEEWFDYRNCINPWDAARDELKCWLSVVAREFGAPDLWKTFTRVPQTARPGPLVLSADNSPFSAAEQKRLRKQLALVGTEIVKSHKSAVKHEGYVLARIEHVSEAVTRLGRRDWGMMVVGVLFQMAMDLGFDAATAKRLFRQVFQELMGSVNRLALPGV